MTRVQLERDKNREDEGPKWTLEIQGGMGTGEQGIWISRGYKGVRENKRCLKVGSMDEGSEYEEGRKGLYVTTYQ